MLICIRILISKSSLLLIIIIPLFNGCTNNVQTDSKNFQVKKSQATSAEQGKEIRNKVLFGNISEVVHYKKSITWINLNNNSASLSLYFNLNSSDTLDMSYSDECWFRFPCEIKTEKVVVYWDTNIDTKYNFNIVKTARQLDKKLIGKPFMVLELINDTTLEATYPIQDIKKAINDSDKNRILFPDKFSCYTKVEKAEI